MNAKVKQFTEIGIVYIAVLFVIVLSPYLLSLAGNIPARALIKYACNILMVGIVVAACKIRKRPVFSELGFVKEKIGRQLLLAVPVFLVTSALFVVIPLLAGVSKNMVLNIKMTDPVVIILNLINIMVFVGMGEEIIFRGYLLGRLKEAANSGIWGVVISAVMFGFMHFPNGQDFLQVIITSILGLIWGFARLKIKNCTTLSVGIAHGLHDTIILVLSCILL